MYKFELFSSIFTNIEKTNSARFTIVKIQFFLNSLFSISNDVGFIWQYIPNGNCVSIKCNLVSKVNQLFRTELCKGRFIINTTSGLCNNLH